MKKFLLILVACCIPLSAMADPALVTTLDEGCEWVFGGDAATGNIHFVLNDGDQWVLSCHGDMITDPPDQAIVVKSTDEDPLGTCFAMGLSSQNVQLVFTPSGKSKFTCWGDIED